MQRAGGAQALRGCGVRVGRSRRSAVVHAWTRRPSPPKAPKAPGDAPSRSADAPKATPAPAKPKTSPKPAREAGSDPVRAGAWTVDEASHRLRIDRYLRASLGGASEKFLDRAVRAGALTLNGKRMSSLEIFVKRGDTVALAPLPGADAADATAAAVNWRARILYEDTALLVIDKPAGVASAPARAERMHALGCCEDMLLARDGPAAPPALFPLHRLDKGTSGVLMLAKEGRLCAPVSRLFRTRAGVSKEYWALLSGWLDTGKDDGDDSAVLWADQLVLGADGKSHVLPADAPPERGGKSAKTGVHVAERMGRAATVVRLAPTTGRMHQLRAQAAARGAPVLGDDRYGTLATPRPGGPPPPPRLCLHCARMALRHPDTAEELVFEAPLPEELAVYTLRLRKAARGSGTAAGAGAAALQPVPA